METFIFKDMKKASLEKDETKIPTLGPYAAALSFILGNASKSRFKKSKDFQVECKNLFVYRGICMTRERFKEQYCPVNESTN